MDTLQTQFIQSRNLEHKINKAKRINYSSLLSLEDPTRLNRNIGTNVDAIILDTMFVYNNCKDAYSYSNGVESFNSTKAADIQLGKSGQLTYKGNNYLVMYYNSPVRTIIGNSFVSSVPTIVSYSNECKSGQIPVLIPPSLPYYLLCDKFAETCGKALLCPGTFKFITFSDENKDVVAIYSPMEVKDYLTLTADENLYASQIKYNNKEIIPYLTDFHTGRVQRGYYSPKESSTYRVFKKYGMSFNTTGKSYYENVVDAKTIDKLSLPFYEHPILSYIMLYISDCNLIQGSLKVPIFCNIEKNEEYNTAIYVDLRVIDLNFIWGEKTKHSSDEYPSSGYYSLTPQDNTFLVYNTKSPNTLVATYGYIKGDHIMLKE